MPYESARSITLPFDTAASADIPQRRFVQMTSTGVAFPSDGGVGTGGEEVVIGTTLEALDVSAPSADRATHVPVALLDGSKLEVELGTEAITAGGAVSTDASGRAKPANAPGDEILGISLDTVGAANAGTIISFIGMKAGRSAT
jgi:FAD/FMN-containing dehydrogenase